jgi:UDP-N-acetylglucosamine--N-acetylmuramyl-(pentapeptide) pyrophosphoryl-undecaprenol N-acetylglucosamine transferase
LEIPLKVKHQTGIGKTHGILDLYSNKIDAEIVEFYDSPQDSMLWSDFIISRAGALSLSEAISLNRGLLMIPLLISIDNHQFLNAQNIVKQGMGLLHEETESFEQLSNKLKEIIDQELHLKWAKKNNNTYHFSAAEKMLSSILKLEKK